MGRAVQALDRRAAPRGDGQRDGECGERREGAADEDRDVFADRARVERVPVHGPTGPTPGVVGRGKGELGREVRGGVVVDGRERGEEGGEAGQVEPDPAAVGFRDAGLRRCHGSPPHVARPQDTG